MKKSSLLILIALLVFVLSFAGSKPQLASSIYVHREDSVIIPNPQYLKANEWSSVMFTHSDGFGPQFKWMDIFPSEVFMVKGAQYRAIGFVTIKVPEGQCIARILYGDGRGYFEELGATTYPSDGEFVVLPVEPQAFNYNAIQSAYVELQAMCDYDAIISNAVMYVVNQ